MSDLRRCLPCRRFAPTLLFAFLLLPSPSLLPSANHWTQLTRSGLGNNPKLCGAVPPHLYPAVRPATQCKRLRARCLRCTLQSFVATCAGVRATALWYRLRWLGPAGLHCVLSCGHERRR